MFNVKDHLVLMNFDHQSQHCCYIELRNAGETARGVPLVNSSQGNQSWFQNKNILVNGQGHTQEFFSGGVGQIFCNKLEHRKQGRGAQLKMFAFLSPPNEFEQGTMKRAPLMIPTFLHPKKDINKLYAMVNAKIENIYFWSSVNKSSIEQNKTK